MPTVSPVGAGRRRQPIDGTVCVPHEHEIAQPEEEAMAGDSGDVRDRLGKGRRIIELRVLAVGDEVAVVGGDRRSGFIGTDGEPQRCLVR